LTYSKHGKGYNALLCIDNGSFPWLYTCPPYFKEESNVTRDFAAQCSMFTYRSSKNQIRNPPVN